MKITNVTAYLIEEEVKPFHWQVDRPGSGDGRSTNKVYNCVIKIETNEGINGYAKGPKGRILMDLVERRFSKDVIGKDPMYSEDIWSKCWDTDRLEEYPIYAIALIDIAVWDIKAKYANLPVYKLLGGSKESIPAYASTTSYDTLEEYKDVVEASLDQGYKSIKLHLRERDVKPNAILCEKVREWVGDDYSLTLDASGLWNLNDSIWFGRVLEELKFEWYEEPMREFELESYKKLCDSLDIPVLAAECSDGAHWNAAEFIRRNACDIMRTSTHYKAGFTGGIKVAHLAESFGMNAEVHGEGHTNLHLCLAIPNCTYYEDLVIDVEDIKNKDKGIVFGSSLENDNLLFSNGTYSFSNNCVGVGINYDDDYLEKTCLDKYEYIKET